MAKKKHKDNKSVHDFYDFHEYNEKTNSTDFYIYGTIINGGNDYKWDDTDVTFEDMRNALNDCPNGSILNMYVNTPGGSVVATQGMVAMLERAKNRDITINAYVDGMACSCGSWIIMVADNIYIYSQSLLMIHKPSSCAWGNADDMRKEIEVLDKIENDVIIPLYMKKVKDGIDEDTLRQYMKDETWFTANEFLDTFNDVTLLKDEKNIACCYDKDIFDNYKNMPENIKEILEREEDNMKDENNKSVLDLFDDENKDTVNSTEPLNQEDSGDVSEPSEPKDDKDNKDDDKKDDKDNKDDEEKDGEEKDNEP